MCNNSLNSCSKKTHPKPKYIDFTMACNAIKSAWEPDNSILKQFLNDFTLFWFIVSCQTMIYIYYNVPSTVILLLMCRRTTLRQNVLCSKKNCEKYDYVIFVWKWSNEVHKIYGIIAKVSKMAELLVYYIIPWPGMSEFWDDISWCYICYVTFRNLFCKANVKISAFLWFLFLRLPCK